MRASQILVLVLLAAIAVDLGLLDEGAFRFDTDESMVGVRAQGRIEMPASARPDIGSPSEPTEPAVLAPPAPRRRVVVGPRPDVPSARSRLVVSADADRSPDAH